MEDFNIPADIYLVPIDNINNKEAAKIMEQSWEQFVTSGTESKFVRREILRSWLRCRESFVDPHKGFNEKLLTYNALKERYNDLHEMINVAKPMMQSLYNSVKGSGYIIMLHDQDGVLLELFGDIGMRRLAESLDVVPGATCDENIVGTTAPGISLKEKIPAQVFFKEHFCMPYHHWTCSAAPIFDPEGKLIGALNLTGLYDKVHPHTLGLVVAAAKAIERELCYRAIHKKLKKSYHYIDTLINSMSEGMISFNDRGEINHINSVCAEMLGFSIEECLGTSINKVIKNAEILTGLVVRERSIYDKKLLLRTEKGTVNVNANLKIVKDGDKNSVTYIGTFNEIGKVQRTVHNNTSLTAHYTFDDLIFVSKEMQNVIDYAHKISINGSTVLIEGESGTGKELLAQAIHNNSKRNKKPFVVVNCAALPKDLIHSELFGYEEGAFTGARKGGKPGKFELANGGTIFLDEIGDMPLEVQANMLRVLQEKQFMRVGGSENIDLDILVIAATNKQLMSEVEKGNFRLDLFYRLNIVPIKIPALQERPQDILPLAQYFLDRQCLCIGMPRAFLSPEAGKIFLSYHWPGNIRELENIITRIVNNLEGEIINIDNLPGEFLRVKSGETGLVIPLEEMERKAIIDALCHYDNNISRTAQSLGITRATLYKKIKKYQIN
ncbi:MAG: sigma 54-interacting transcriptional regulator [Bacillota bacterium]|nr:sigma 54-interacting transcriptional regulator [Bacillota bacterium]